MRPSVLFALPILATARATILGHHAVAAVAAAAAASGTTTASGTSTSTRLLTTAARRAVTPPLEYPVCHGSGAAASRGGALAGTTSSSSSSSSSSNSYSTASSTGSISGGHGGQDQSVMAADRMAQPAEVEREILGTNKAREEALKTEAQLKVKAEEHGEEKEQLPKLSAADFKVYNSMADHMEYFHNHFRQTWTMMYSSCEANQRPAGMSLRQFLGAGLQFISHLTVHHDIEEQHIFPVLALRMPEFAAGKGGPAAELLRQHREIHAGMDVFAEYLRRCRDGEADFELAELKRKMDGWGGVLWKHLDQEVRTLGAENMRRYWSKEEMRSMPM